MDYNEKIAEILGQLEIFSGLSSSHLMQIALLMDRKTKPKDAYLILENQKGEDIFCILKGEVKVQIFLPGSQQRSEIASMAGGDIIGELALVGCERRSASVQVTREIEYLSTTVSKLKELFQKDQELGFFFYQNLARLLAHRLIGTNKNLGNAIYSQDGVFKSNAS